MLASLSLKFPGSIGLSEISVVSPCRFQTLFVTWWRCSENKRHWSCGCGCGFPNCARAWAGWPEFPHMLEIHSVSCQREEATTNLASTRITPPSEWMLTHNLDHKCAESLFQKTLHNVFTRFQSGPAFLPLTFSWASLGTEVWRHLSFVQDLDVFHYSRPRWGYTIPLASNAGRATRGARNKLPLLLGTVSPC